MEQIERTLEEQRREFSNRKFLATPLAGMIVWLLIGISGLLFPVGVTVWVLYIGTGSIVYLGMLISRFTGENFLDKKKPKNTFDTLFFFTVGQAMLVYAIALPFFLVDYLVAFFFFSLIVFSKFTINNQNCFYTCSLFCFFCKEIHR